MKNQQTSPSSTHVFQARNKKAPSRTYSVASPAISTLNTATSVKRPCPQHYRQVCTLNTHLPYRNIPNQTRPNVEALLLSMGKKEKGAAPKAQPTSQTLRLVPPLHLQTHSRLEKHQPRSRLTRLRYKPNPNPNPTATITKTKTRGQGRSGVERDGWMEPMA